MISTLVSLLLISATLDKTVLVASKPSSSKKGCTAPFVLPGKPFIVVWNHPSQTCEDHGIHIDFEKWGIVDNSKDRFVGEEIALLYRPGNWPYYSGSTTHNGGIPQLGNKTSHMQSFVAALESQIPDGDFSGLGVIDFEKWRPLYSLNFDSLQIYQEKSLELARQKYPHYNKSQVLDEAVQEFERAARFYMEKSLRTATDLRPGGKWGYYGFPRCWDANCNSSTISNNDRMGWLFAASSGLYPSIYFDLSLPPASRADMITKRLRETIRVKAKWAPTDAAIFPYALIQNGPLQFFTSTDLQYSVRQPADLGSSGVLLWGSSASMHAKNECIALQDYVNTTLGPFTKQVTDFFSNCSAQLCSAHGRCVRKDYEATYQHHLVLGSGCEECWMQPWRLYRKGDNHTSQGRQLEARHGRVANSRHERLGVKGGKMHYLFRGRFRARRKGLGKGRNSLHRRRGCIKWRSHPVQNLCRERRWRRRRQRKIYFKSKDSGQSKLLFEKGLRGKNQTSAINRKYLKPWKLADYQSIAPTMQSNHEKKFFDNNVSIARGSKAQFSLKFVKRRSIRGFASSNNFAVLKPRGHRKKQERRQLKKFSSRSESERQVISASKDFLNFSSEINHLHAVKKSRRNNVRSHNQPGRQNGVFTENQFRESVFEDYVCKCFAGWSGQHCDDKDSA